MGLSCFFSSNYITQNFANALICNKCGNKRVSFTPSPISEADGKELESLRAKKHTFDYKLYKNRIWVGCGGRGFPKRAASFGESR